MLLQPQEPPPLRSLLPDRKPQLHILQPFLLLEQLRQGESGRSRHVLVTCMDIKIRVAHPCPNEGSDLVLKLEKAKSGCVAVFVEGFMTGKTNTLEDREQARVNTSKRRGDGVEAWVFEENIVLVGWRELAVLLMCLKLGLSL